MLAVLGWLYIVAPVRICNNYLVNQQESAGWWMVDLALLLFGCWIGSLFVGGNPRLTQPIGCTRPVDGAGA